MRYADADPSVPLIRRLTLAVDDGYCTLRWLWPEGVEAVYVERLELEMVEGGQSRDQTVNGKLKLYTREEYKASNGYTDRMTGFGAIRYTIHVCRMDEDGPVLLRQQNDENTVIASAGKADIRFSIRYKSGFFQKGRRFS